MKVKKNYDCVDSYLEARYSMPLAMEYAQLRRSLALKTLSR
jgi:hypothetical protein